MSQKGSEKSSCDRSAATNRQMFVDEQSGVPRQCVSSEGRYCCWATNVRLEVGGNHVRWRAWEMFAQFKCMEANGARRARREKVDSWHTGARARQVRRDKWSLFVENCVAITKRPVDLVRAAVDLCSGKQWRWLACCKSLQDVHAVNGLGMDLVRRSPGVCDSAKFMEYLVRLLVLRILSGCSASPQEPSAKLRLRRMCQTVSGLVGVCDTACAGLKVTQDCESCGWLRRDMPLLASGVAAVAHGTAADQECRVTHVKGTKL